MMAFPQDPLEYTVELALGADLTADPSTWVWTDITEWCRAPLRVTGIGQADEDSSATSAKLTVTVVNDDGRFVRLNPNSPWYGLLDKDTPLRASVTDGIVAPSTRFFGFIAELPPRWQPGYDDQWVPVTANGVLRRLDQIDVEDSALKRFVLSTTKLHAYWPLEDGTGASLGAPATPGQNAMRAVTVDTSGVSWGAESDLPGSYPVVRLGDGATIGTRVIGTSRGPWAVSYAAKGELASGSIDGDWTSMRIEPADTDVQWIITGTDTNVTVQMRDINTGATSTVLDADSELTNLSLLDDWHSVALLADGPAGGGTVTVSIFVDGQLGDTITIPGRSVGRLDQIFVPDAFDTADIDSIGIGHVAIWEGINTGVFSGDDVWRLVDYHKAATGFWSETAGDRVRRLCTEQGIAHTVEEGTAIGGTPASSRMGAQSPATVAALLHECEKADGGLLFETPQDAGIGYVARSRLYEIAAQDASPALALDNDESAGDLAGDFEPADDDQQTVNDMTVSRTGGASARVQRVPDGKLAYPRSTTLDVAADGAVAHQASWRIHLGMVEEYRYPVITLDLASHPELIDDWTACGIGSRITIDNPPPGHPPDQLDLFVLGYSEAFDTDMWTVSLNCTSATPYEVATFPGELTVVQEGFEDANLNITITDGGDAAWARTEDDAHHGSWSLRSGAITDSQTSDAIITVPAGCTRVRFWYRTSCEPGFDFFRVIVGGNTVVEASGVSAWTLTPYLEVTPAGTITLRYLKDSSLSRFGDRVYVDDVQFEGGADSTTNAERARLDTSGSELASGVSSSDTSLSVATTAGPVWTTEAGDMPFDISVGGEVMTVTAIAGATSPQTFTVTRSVNGVEKAHSSGAPVSVTHPMILALGD